MRKLPASGMPMISLFMDLTSVETSKAGEIITGKAASESLGTGKMLAHAFLYPRNVVARIENSYS